MSGSAFEPMRTASRPSNRLRRRCSAVSAPSGDITARAGPAAEAFLNAPDFTCSAISARKSACAELQGVGAK